MKNSHPVQNWKYSSCWSECSGKCLQLRKSKPKRDTPNNHSEEHLVEFRTCIGKESNTINGIQLIVYQHLIMCSKTHSDDQSWSKLTVSYQSGSIPVMVGKRKTTHGHSEKWRKEGWKGGSFVDLTQIRVQMCWILQNIVIPRQWRWVRLSSN